MTYRDTNDTTRSKNTVDPYERLDGGYHDILGSDEQYNVSDTEIDMVLLDIPLELMKDNIRAQVNDIQIDVDYMAIVSDKVDYLRKLYHEDPETNNKINDLMMDIAQFVISEICDRFGWDYYIDMHPDEAFELAQSMYYSLILNYSKNIKKYLYNYITTHRKEIFEKYNSKKKDVTTNSVKKKVKNREMVIIISNLPLIVREIVEVAPETDEFFENLSYYEAEQVYEKFNSFELSGSMDGYFSVLTEEYNFIIDRITDGLKDKLIS